MVEYDSYRGFKCERCGKWTYGGSLYPGRESARVCGICRMDDSVLDLNEKLLRYEARLMELRSQGIFGNGRELYDPKEPSFGRSSRR